MALSEIKLQVKWSPTWWRTHWRTVGFLQCNQFNLEPIYSKAKTHAFSGLGWGMFPLHGSSFYMNRFLAVHLYEQIYLKRVIRDNFFGVGGGGCYY